MQIYKIYMIYTNIYSKTFFLMSDTFYLVTTEDDE